MELWRNFFSNDYLKFSENILTEERTNYELKFLLNNLDLPNNAKILDLGCGQGRISIPLAKLGYQVIGLDASKDLLYEASKRAKKESVEIEFLNLDMRNMDFLNEFDAIINMGTAFGYVEKQSDDEIILKKVYQALKPNGVFIQDLENRESKVSNYNKQTWYYMNDKIVFNKREYDFITGRWNEEIKWKEDGEEKESILNLRLYSATEIVYMNQKVGFKFINSFGFYDNQRYFQNSPRMIMKYKKM